MRVKKTHELRYNADRDDFDAHHQIRHSSCSANLGRILMIDESLEETGYVWSKGDKCDEMNMYASLDMNYQDFYFWKYFDDKKELNEFWGRLVDKKEEKYKITVIVEDYV